MLKSKMLLLIHILSSLNECFPGFTVTNTACCGIGRNGGQLTCLPGQPPCLNRDEYVFWDAFHPSAAANTVIAQRSYNAQRSSDVNPIDISQLAQL